MNVMHTTSCPLRAELRGGSAAFREAEEIAAEATGTAEEVEEEEAREEHENEAIQLELDIDTVEGEDEEDEEDAVVADKDGDDCPAISATGGLGVQTSFTSVSVVDKDSMRLRTC
jgi:hypothetical protein